MIYPKWTNMRNGSAALGVVQRTARGLCLADMRRRGRGAAGPLRPSRLGKHSLEISALAAAAALA